MWINTRVIVCEACDGEGSIQHDTGNREHETGAAIWTCEPCPHCDGTGGEVIETQPITIDDLDALAGGPAQFLIGALLRDQRAKS